MGMIIFQYPSRPRREPDLTIECYYFWFKERIFGHGVWYYNFKPETWVVYHAGLWDTMGNKEWMNKYECILNNAYTDWLIEKELL